MYCIYHPPAHISSNWCLICMGKWLLHRGFVCVLFAICLNAQRLTIVQRVLLYLVNALWGQAQTNWYSLLTHKPCHEGFGKACFWVKVIIFQQRLWDGSKLAYVSKWYLAHNLSWKFHLLIVVGCCLLVIPVLCILPICILHCVLMENKVIVIPDWL